MRRFWWAFVLLSLAAGLLAQSSLPTPNQPDAAPSPPAPCIVAGRVVTAAEGTPVKSAHVTLWQQNKLGGPHADIYDVSTDGEGHFLVKDVTPGRYEFVVSHTGFVSQHYQANGEDEGAVLALTAGQKITDVLFRMRLAAVITGRVNDAEGGPMVGIQVTALRPLNEEEIEEQHLLREQKTKLIPAATAWTDDRGQYRIFGLKPGEYYLRAAESDNPTGTVEEDNWVRQRLGSEYAPLYFPGALRLDQAQVVSVSAGEEAQAGFSLRRVRTVTVSGRVLGPEGPVTRGSVFLHEADEQVYESGHQDFTDAKGNFTLKGIPPGSYMIGAYVRVDENQSYQAQQKLEVGNEDIDSLNLVVGGSITVQGRVTTAGSLQAASEHLMITLTPVSEEQQEGSFVRVKKDGTFELASVPDGSYALYMGGLKQGWYVKSARFGQDDVLEKGLQMEKENASAKLEIVVSSDSAQLDGSVSDGDRDLVGARVRVVPDPETTYNRHRVRVEKTDQTGHFAVTALPPGKYRVLAMVSAMEGAARKSDPQNITLSEHEHKSIRLTIPRPEKE